MTYKEPLTFNLHGCYESSHYKLSSYSMYIWPLDDQQLVATYHTIVGKHGPKFTLSIWHRWSLGHDPTHKCQVRSTLVIDEDEAALEEDGHAPLD